MAAEQQKVRFLESIIEALPEGVVVTDENMNLVVFNEAAKKMLGVGNKNVSPDQWVDLYGCFRPDGEKFKTEELPIYRAMKGETVDNVVILIKNEHFPEGVFISVSARPLVSPDGRVEGSIASFRDVSKAVRSESESGFLQSLINSLPNAMFCKEYKTDEKGDFVAWNHQAECLWGLKPEQVLGKSDFDFFPEEQAKYFLEKDLETLRSGKMVYIDEEQVDSPVVGTRIVRTWKVPVVEKDRRFLLGISLDITPMKELEKQLDEEKVRNLHAGKLAALGEMAGGIAHEINSPLMIIQGACHMTKVRARKHQDAKIEASMERTLKTVARIGTIVNGLKKFARDDNEGAFTKANMASIIDDTTSLCFEKFKNNQVQFEIEKIDLEVECNSVQIAQVLINLLNNAFDAVEEVDDRQISLIAKQIEDSVVVEVSDNGKGVPQDVVEKVFEPFFTTKVVGKGTGLGLSISKSIIKDHNGSLDHIRRDGRTVFSLTLPLEQPANMKDAG